MPKSASSSSSSFLEAAQFTPRTVYKTGKVAVVLSGRYAGKKVVVIKQSDEGTKQRAYPHAIVVGIDRYPRKITRNMGAKKVAKRSRVKPFIKVRHARLVHLLLHDNDVAQAINYNHLMPTRYALELESIKSLLTSDTFKEVRSLAMTDASHQTDT